MRGSGSATSYQRSGNTAFRSPSSGSVARARSTSARSSRARRIATASSSSDASSSPRGETTHDAARHPLAALEAGQTGVEHVHAVFARHRASAIARQRSTLSSIPAPASPRPGDALGMTIRRAPLSAAIVGMIECQASSQIRIAAAAERRRETSAAAGRARGSVPRRTRRRSARTSCGARARPARPVAAERRVERAVVIRAVVVFVEAADDVDRRRARRPRATRRRASRRTSRPEARARRPRLRGNSRSSPLRATRSSCGGAAGPAQQLREHVAQRREVAGDVALARLALDDRDVEASSRDGERPRRRRSSRRSPRPDRSRSRPSSGADAGSCMKSNTSAS